MKQRVVVIGGGLGGLAAACLLGKAGYRVTVLEQSKQLGGRAGVLKAKGFTFDTGPSWYLMPDVIEHFFALLGEQPSSFFQLTKLTPAFRSFFAGTGERIDITGNLATDCATFEQFERGAGDQLARFEQRTRHIYDLVVGAYCYKNYGHITDIIGRKLPEALLRIPLNSWQQFVDHSFHDRRLQSILLHPSLFLGTSPDRAPALYSFLNYAELNQGVYYPAGGIYQLVEALVSLGKRFGVTYRTDHPVEHITMHSGQVSGVIVRGKELFADIVVSNADMQYTETTLLEAPYRDHRPAYWQTRSLAPSALLMYLGVNRQFPSLSHHNLLFGLDAPAHIRSIIETPSFPANPSLYVCAPSKTDPQVAPAGQENLFVLVPMGAGVNYTERQLERYADTILKMMEREMGLPGLIEHIRFRQLMCAHDFTNAYHSPGGSALGLAHTLGQSAMFRPRNVSRKAPGLYYVGAGVNPGIGMPSALISAELLYKRLRGDHSSAPLRSI